MKYLISLNEQTPLQLLDFDFHEAGDDSFMVCDFLPDPEKLSAEELDVAVKQKEAVFRAISYWLEEAKG